MFLVGLAMACGASALAQGSTERRAIAIAGVVLDSAAAPVAAASVAAVEQGATLARGETDANGRFSLSFDRSEESILVVRRLGYVERRVALNTVRPGDSLVVVLARLPAELAEVRVRAQGADAEGIGAWLDGFNSRRTQNSFGRFYTGAELRSSGVYQTSEILRTVPGVRVSASARYGNAVRMRGCRRAPIVWLDGTRVADAELDDVARPGDIAGMEVYTSMSGVPAQFMDREHSPCGTIVLWTRHR